MGKIKWIFGLAAILATALVMMNGTAHVLAGGPSGGPASNAAVKIDNFSFGPATITIPA